MVGLAEPRLDIARTSIYRGQVKSVFQRTDGRIVVSGSFPQAPFTTGSSSLFDEIAILETNGVVLQRICPPQIQEPGIPILVNWLCQAVLSDNSMIIERSVREPFKGEVLPRKLLRILPDGRVDLKSLLPFGQVSVQPDGRVLVSGENSYDVWDPRLDLFRFTLGTDTDSRDAVRLNMDDGFAGILNRHSYTNVTCLAAVPAPDGSIYLWLAQRQVPLNTVPSARLGRILSDGRRDDSFRPPESLVRRVDSSFAWLPLPDGKLLVSLIEANGNPLTTRLNHDGSLDPAYPLGDSERFVSGYLLGSGPEGPAVFESVGPFLARLLPDGSRDTSFALVSPAIRAGEFGLGFGIQSDGKFLGLVRVTGDLIQNVPVALVRFNTDGSIDRLFDASSLSLVPSIRLSASGVEPGKFYTLDWFSDVSDATDSESVWSGIPNLIGGSDRAVFLDDVVPRFPGDRAFGDGPAGFYRLSEEP